MKLLNLNQDAATLLQTAFSEDTLLCRYPPELGAVVALLQVLRNLIRTNSFVQARATFLTDELHFADILRAMQSTFLS
jgi:hypothetical protein